MSQSVTSICNRALQRLGAARINTINDQSVNARQCNTCYDILRQAVLREHPWNFAIQRFQLAAAATPPLFSSGNYYPLPTGWLRLLPPDEKQNYNNRDWIIEGGAVVSDYMPPLEVRCVMDITDTTLMDPTFCEALSARMAFDMCEALTQSSSKQQNIAGAYKEIIAIAKKVNAIEKVPQAPAEDVWVTARLNNTGVGGTGWGWGTGG